METIRRAYIYVIRKKGKSILLLFILLVMAAFVLTGLSIEKASGSAQRSLREALGGRFFISAVLSESNPYFRMDDDGEGAFDLYTELPITQDLINAVMGVDGVKRYEAETKTFVSTTLDVFPGNVPLKAEYNNRVYARTVSDTENNSFFVSGTAELTAGKHITGKEGSAAVISKDLADKNGLRLGDFISLQADKTADVKVIGIYEIRRPDSPFENIATYEKAENQIFTDIDTLQNLFAGMPVGFYEAAFTVYDPAQLDEIISEVKGLAAIDWRAFEAAADNQAYLEAAAPLQKLQALVSSIIWVTALVSVVILSLILTMWGRNRIHETGVFLSLGIKKTKIIGQYLAEVLMIAVIAFGCAYPVSRAAAGQISGLLQKDISAGVKQQDDGIDIQVKEGYGEDITVSRKDENAASDKSSAQDAAPEVEVAIDGMGAETSTETGAETGQISVSVDFYNMLQLCLIGLIVIVLSVGISSLAVMRLKPREILSKMS